MKSTLIALLLLLALSTAAAEDSDCEAGQETKCPATVVAEDPRAASLAGPEQVENRLHIDSNQVTPLFPSSFARGWFDWKERQSTENGFTLGADYTSVYLNATESPGEDDAFGGMYRMFGSWEATSDGQGNSGALIFKAEHRHAYGSNLPPGSLGFEVGYVGLIEPPFSDAGGSLTNLYWRQRMKGGNLVLVGGIVDVTDYVDVYMLASPWTGFFNFAFSTGSATIPAPNQGLGLALGGYLDEQFYLIGGFADLNADPTDPFEGFDTFFNDHEFFKHLEFGWNRTRETAFLDNVHLTLWHADEMTEAGNPDGWGVNLSWSRQLTDQWLGFLRGGWADDGGTLLETSVSVGGAWQTVPGGNQLGLAFNWGEPNATTWGPGLSSQKTLEVFYRIQLFRELAITPDLQYIRDPALNPAADDLWVFGLRARLAF
jgi:porin